MRLSRVREAWFAIGDVTKDKAKEKYIQLVETLFSPMLYQVGVQRQADEIPAKKPASGLTMIPSVSTPSIDL